MKNRLHHVGVEFCQACQDLDTTVQRARQFGQHTACRSFRATTDTLPASPLWGRRYSSARCSYHERHGNLLVRLCPTASLFHQVRKLTISLVVCPVCLWRSELGVGGRSYLVWEVEGLKTRLLRGTQALAMNSMIVPRVHPMHLLPILPTLLMLFALIHRWDFGAYRFE